MDREKGNWMDGWMDGRMNGWMDEWMNGWMDEDTCTHIQIIIKRMRFVMQLKCIINT